MQSERKKNLKTYGTFALVILLTIAATSYCVVFNVGPMNELACVYKGVENPTYREMTSFIKNDKTNLNQYTVFYKCGSFSYDVIKNAKEQGIQAGYVTIWGEPDNHAIVAFQTTDRGLWFLEPQSDAVFSHASMERMLDDQQYYITNGDSKIDFHMTGYSINWFFGVRT